MPTSKRLAPPKTIMTMPAKSAKRTSLEWDRLVRRSIADLRSRRKKMRAQATNLAKAAAVAHEEFAAAAWKSQAFAIGMGNKAFEGAGADQAWSLLARLAKAASDGCDYAMHAHLDRDGIVSEDNHRLNAFGCVMRAIGGGALEDPRSGKDIARNGNGSQMLMRAIHQFLESVAMGAAGDGHRLLMWHTKTALEHAKGSTGYLPQEWPMALTFSDKLRRMFIRESVANNFFLGTMLFPCEAHSLKQASQRKDIDTHGLHGYVRLCAKLSACDPELFAECAARAIECSKRCRIPLDEPRMARFSGEILPISLFHDIERGLCEAIHDPHGKSMLCWDVERAQWTMADLCAGLGIWPSAAEANPYGSAALFRAAVEAKKDALEISGTMPGAGKPRQNKKQDEPLETLVSRPIAKLRI